VREHPELAGTSLSLRAAEVAARGLRDSEDQQRFLAQVRRALADDIARGEPCSQFDYVREAPWGPHDRHTRWTARSPAECSIHTKDLGSKPAWPDELARRS
jgi:hypothetical protein